MKINAKQKQMELLEAVIGGAAYNGPPYRRYRRACIRYRHPRSRFSPGSLPVRSSATPWEDYNFKEEEDYCRQTTYRPITETIYRPLQRTPSNARRHALGRLRARCGSNAQQSCVPATTLSS